MRVLVTGSRDWTDERRVAQAIVLRMFSRKEDEPFVIVHGDCSTGADALAQKLADEHGISTERHPAAWGNHGRAAGPMRNQAMVDLGADVCLAFPVGASPGTRDCMRRAEKAGIRVIDYGASSE